ncbi:hypothetical protein [Thalassobaculum sp.]|uniref:hypothetical protein n=1 Tax=Thalassobaculum sp. TaxID=2022740 RepID=UPI0032EADD3E
MYIERKLQLVNRLDRPDLARGDRRVHYLHVPKCGGTTLRYVLEGFAATRGLSAENEARRIEGVAPDLGKAQVVMGHEFPSDGLTRNDTCYFTVLRDPVRRLRSLVGMLAERDSLPPEDIARNLTWKQANWAVYLLTGATGPEDGLVARAKDALENRVHVFGFQENLNEFVALLAATLDVDGVIFPSFQFTPNSLRVDDKFDSMFAAMATADRELFDFARALYRERFASRVSPEDASRRQIGRNYLCIRIRAEDDHVDVSEVTFSD